MNFKGPNCYTTPNHTKLEMLELKTKKILLLGQNYVKIPTVQLW